MTNTKVFIALGLVLAAVLIQTTLFQYLRPFGYVPALGMLMVIALARYLEPEQALFVAFTGGFLQDILGGAPLGLWAIAFTIVAFITSKVRDREITGTPVVLLGVFVLTVIGQFTYAVLGTLFGQGIINRPGFIGDLLVPSLYNVILAYLVFWLVKITVRPPERS
ncbi:MAG: rod shape-determining protein MreD, partial [Actinomycetota bacterium]|nr:rod shape-determining protein MreD [Actinomycetota bacterium]